MYQNYLKLNTSITKKVYVFKLNKEKDIKKSHKK